MVRMASDYLVMSLEDGNGIANKGSAPVQSKLYCMHLSMVSHRREGLGGGEGKSGMPTWFKIKE